MRSREKRKAATEAWFGPVTDSACGVVQAWADDCNAVQVCQQGAAEQGMERAAMQAAMRAAMQATMQAARQAAKQMRIKANSVGKRRRRSRRDSRKVEARRAE